MIIGFGVVALIAAYLRIGVRHALANRKQAWARARAVWGHKHERYAMESVRWSMVRMTAFWPIILTGRALDSALKAADPVHIAQQARRHARLKAAADRRTLELEQELGIGEFA